MTEGRGPEEDRAHSVIQQFYEHSAADVCGLATILHSDVMLHERSPLPLGAAHGPHLPSAKPSFPAGRDRIAPLST
jgi:hypothetical protein